MKPSSWTITPGTPNSPYCKEATDEGARSQRTRPRVRSRGCGHCRADRGRSSRQCASVRPVPHRRALRHSAILGTDLKRARRVASQIRAGRVVINGMTDDPQAPWGGFKYSGFGREYGQYGAEAFLETRAILES